MLFRGGVSVEVVAVVAPGMIGSRLVGLRHNTVSAGEAANAGVQVARPQMHQASGISPLAGVAIIAAAYACRMHDTAKWFKVLRQRYAPTATCKALMV